ncbi:DUF4421 family protein [Poritiphilus flavus]|uniref:DUF4421 domain-containing protein n=1 Tax=Poritiphilus flavus TaxID=2697053 RepID=A0A6L9E890_9FLAO|nr:DUF4421 family protein [Poritiphilus flavus]NAS10864.1 DUF4421 domain-containing protein [Poritiphilus flavus]
MDLKQWLWYFLLCPLFFFGQDSTYIRSFPEKITFRLGLQNTSNTFIVNDTGSGQQITLEPNDKVYLGGSILFRSIELDLGFAPNFFDANNDNSGTRLLTFNFRMFLGRWMQTLDFYSQKGFSFTSSGNAVFFPDVSTLKIGGTTSYIFNKRFSFRAIGFQNEWQKKSAGSFIPGFTAYYTKFDLNSDDFSSDSQSYDFALGPGYYYNLVIGKHFILGAGNTSGLGINITRSDSGNNTSLLFETVFRVVFGYNSERFFTGLNSRLLYLSHNTDRYTRLDDTIGFVEFYLGYRFDAPKKWVKAADKFNSKFGFD